MMTTIMTMTDDGDEDGSGRKMADGASNMHNKAWEYMSLQQS